MIFYFEDPIVFLNAQFQEIQKENPRFSLREWSRQMGYQNPSLLFQVLRRERRLKMDLTHKLSTYLKLKGKAARYFELMVLECSCQSEPEKQVFRNLLTKLRPRKLRSANLQALDVFAVSAEWYHGAILAMTDLIDFEPDSGWIQKRLGSEVDKKTIKQALERLLRLGYLSQRHDGRLVKTEKAKKSEMSHIETSIEAQKQYHCQMIEKAKAVIERQTDRWNMGYHKGTTVSFHRSDLSKVDEIIAEAHRKILALSAESNGDDVYQLNSQFFPLTKKKATHQRKLRNAVLAAVILQFNFMNPYIMVSISKMPQALKGHFGAQKNAS